MELSLRKMNQHIPLTNYDNGCLVKEKKKKLMHFCPKCSLILLSRFSPPVNLGTASTCVTDVCCLFMLMYFGLAELMCLRFFFA